MPFIFLLLIDSAPKSGDKENLQEFYAFVMKTSSKMIGLLKNKGYLRQFLTHVVFPAILRRHLWNKNPICSTCEGTD